MEEVYWREAEERESVREEKGKQWEQEEENEETIKGRIRSRARKVEETVYE